MLYEMNENNRFLFNMSKKIAITKRTGFVL